MALAAEMRGLFLGFVSNLLDFCTIKWMQMWEVRSRKSMMLWEFTRICMDFV
jgi:hypothetical protein